MSRSKRAGVSAYSVDFRAKARPGAGAQMCATVTLARPRFDLAAGASHYGVAAVLSGPKVTRPTWHRTVRPARKGARPCMTR